jgi:hypothetical protein
MIIDYLSGFSVFSASSTAANCHIFSKFYLTANLRHDIIYIQLNMSLEPKIKDFELWMVKVKRESGGNKYWNIEY